MLVRTPEKKINKHIKGNCAECQFEPENGHAQNCSKREVVKRGSGFVQCITCGGKTGNHIHDYGGKNT